MGDIPCSLQFLYSFRGCGLAISLNQAKLAWLPKGDIQKSASGVGEGGECTAPSSGSMIVDVFKPTVKPSSGGDYSA